MQEDINFSELERQGQKENFAVLSIEWLVSADDILQLHIILRG